jgi:hypothetical protein
MTLFLIILAVMLLFFALMGIGLIVARKPIRGTCASLSTINIGGPCEICGGDPAKCDAEAGDNTAEGGTGSQTGQGAVQQYPGTGDATPSRRY